MVLDLDFDAAFCLLVKSELCCTAVPTRSSTMEHDLMANDFDKTVLSMAIKLEYGVEFSPAEMKEIRVLGQLMDALKHKLGKETSDVF